MISVIEISPGVFTTDRPHILTSLDGERQATLVTVLSPHWSEEERAEFGLFMVAPAAVPTGHRVTAISYERIDGAVTQVVETAPVIPGSITPRQLKLALLDAGLLDAIEAFVAAAPREVQIGWNNTVEYLRTDALLNEMAAAFGMTAEQIDGIFIAAAAK